MKKSENRYLSRLDIAGVCLLSLMALLSLSFATSPFFYAFGSDSIEYKLAGSLILDGGVVFRDIFHQKGALFFFVEALGELLCRLFGDEKIGTLFLQWVNMSITLCLALYGSKKYMSEYGPSSNASAKTAPYIILPAVLIFWLALFTYGNQVEEFAVLYEFAAAYLCVMYCIKLRELKAEFNPVGGFVMGVCLGVTVWFKPTTSIVIIGCAFFVFVELLVNKRFLCIFKNIGTGLIGIAVITVPVLLYYKWHGALYDMIEQSFLFNLYYTNANKEIVETFQQKVLTITTVVLFPAASLVLAVINRFRPISLLALTMCLVNAVMFHFTSVSYMFYAQPEVVCFFVLLLALLDTKLAKALVNIALCGVLLASIAFCATDKYVKLNNSYPFYKEILAQAEEFDSFYDNASEYFENDNGDRFNTLILTSSYLENRYISYHYREYPYINVFSAEFFSRVQSQEYVERFNASLDENPPKLVVKDKSFNSNCHDFCDSYELVYAKLETDYEQVYAEGDYILYELKK